MVCSNSLHGSFTLIRTDRGSWFSTLTLIGSVLVGTSWSCATENLPPDEQSFRHTVRQWHAGVARAIKIQADWEKPEGGWFKFHFRRRSLYVRKHEKMFMESERKLREFMHGYPDSKWADDAAVCLCLQYAVISLPQSPYTDKAVSAYRRVIEEYPEGELEPWTIGLLDRMVGIRQILAGEFALSTAVPLKECSVWTRLRQCFLYMRVTEYLKIEDFERAELEYAEMKNASLLDDSLAMDLAGHIATWRSRSRKYPAD